MNAYFVALSLPDHIRSELAALTGDLAGVHWLNEDQYHITLGYFGQLNNETANNLKRSLNSVKQKPLNLRLGAVRLYPETGEPRTIVTAVLRDDNLDNLRKKINRAAIEIGLERKRERYHPHVTLGRFTPHGWITGHPEHLSDFLVKRATYQSQPFDLFCFSLFNSRKTEAGYRYELEADYDLI